jgi:hypothetical protein
MRTRLTLIALLFAAAALAFAGQASAQALRLAPSLIIAAGYDDNVFWAPNGESDVVLRVTPGLSFERKGPRAKLVGTYNFDAEHYRNFSTMTNAFVRQSASGTGQFLKSTATTFILGGGYDTTTRPAELNVDTGLGAGILSGHRWFGHTELKHSYGPKTTVDFGYDFGSDVLSLGEQVQTHGVTFLATRQANQRDELRLKFEGQRFLFHGSEAFDGPDEIMSGVAMVGWTSHLTPLTSLTFSAGPRVSNGNVRPEIEAIISRLSGPNEFSLSYARTQATALGLRGLIDVDRVLGTNTYRLPGRIDTTLQGGVYRNQSRGATVNVYRAMADVTKYLATGVGISISYSSDMQHGLLGTELLPGLAPPLINLRPDLAPVPTMGWVRRNLILFRVLIVPELGRSTKPPEREGGQQ